MYSLVKTIGNWRHSISTSSSTKNKRLGRTRKSYPKKESFNHPAKSNHNLSWKAECVPMKKEISTASTFRLQQKGWKREHLCSCHLKHLPPKIHLLIGKLIILGRDGLGDGGARTHVASCQELIWKRAVLDGVEYGWSTRRVGTCWNGTYETHIVHILIITSKNCKVTNKRKFEHIFCSINEFLCPYPYMFFFTFY